MAPILVAILAASTPATAQRVWVGEAAAPDSAPVDAITPQDLLIVLDELDIEAKLKAQPEPADARVHPLAISAVTDELAWEAIFYNCDIRLAPPEPEAPAGEEVEAAPAEEIDRGPTQRLRPPPPPDARAAPAETSEDGMAQQAADAAARGCRDFAFSAAFDMEYPVSVQTINRYNREYRFARAVLSDEGAPIIEMDVNLEGGISRRALQVEIDAWRALLVSFADYVGY